jgi:hypothetical protein
MGGFMGKVLGIILLILIALFAFCSCKAASWADQEMEEELNRREQDEKKDL